MCQRIFLSPFWRYQKGERLICGLSGVSAGCACFARGGRFSGVEGGMRGWSPPGVPRSEGRGAGVLAVNGAAAFKVGFVPDDEAPVLGSAPDSRWRREPRPRRCSCALECPALVRLAAGSALFWCRRGAVSASGVQNGGDQPGQHAAQHRKHTGNTTKTPGHRTVS